MKKINNQSGFSLVELFLVIIIVILLGVVGYYVWHNHKDSQSKTSLSTTSSHNTFVGWKTYTGNPTTNPGTPSGGGDGVVYSFEYPQSWIYYPIGTVENVNGTNATNSFQELEPNGGPATSTDGLIFSSVATNLDAQSYYKQSVGDQSGLTGPTWQGVSSFTTKNDYSGYNSELAATTGTTYETIVSNGKGAVVFNYGKSSYLSTYKQIFDTVKIP